MTLGVTAPVGGDPEQRFLPPALAQFSSMVALWYGFTNRFRCSGNLSDLLLRGMSPTKAGALAGRRWLMGSVDKVQNVPDIQVGVTGNGSCIPVP